MTIGDNLCVFTHVVHTVSCHPIYKQTKCLNNSPGILTQKFFFEKAVDYISSFRLKELVHDSPSII